jgi:ribosomal-protein-alanine N-acetyltransferase
MESSNVDNAYDMPVDLRWFLHRIDLPQVLSIENKSFDTPWNEDFINKYIRRHDVLPYVAEVDEKIVGFVFYELNSDSYILSNIAVSPQARRRDVGTQLSNRLISKLSSGKREEIVLDINQDAEEGILFFQSQGYAIRESPEKLDDSFCRMSYRLSDHS